MRCQWPMRKYNKKKIKLSLNIIICWMPYGGIGAEHRRQQTNDPHIHNTNGRARQTLLHLYGSRSIEYPLNVSLVRIIVCLNVAQQMFCTRWFHSRENYVKLFCAWRKVFIFHFKCCCNIFLNCHEWIASANGTFSFHSNAWQKFDVMYLWWKNVNREKALATRVICCQFILTFLFVLLMTLESMENLTIQSSFSITGLSLLLTTLLGYVRLNAMRTLHSTEQRFQFNWTNDDVSHNKQIKH